MKIIVTHASPDWDAISSVWLIKKFLPGWEESTVQFVPAGERIGNIKYQISNVKFPIEKIGEDEVIHVDTGLGPLDHHQTSSVEVSSVTLTWEFVITQNPEFQVQTEKIRDRKEAIERMLKVLTEIDHFKEVFWENPTADYHEFSLSGLLEGFKLEKPGEDLLYIDFGAQCLDGLLHNFENRIWAEKEIKEKGKEFDTKWGKALGLETINDSVLKLAQKTGYVLVIRKDPRKGYVRIKARPAGSEVEKVEKVVKGDVDLTNVYEKLRKMEPEASWFLHVSKKMLLNGTPKNPKMKATKLSLDDIIRVLETI